MSSEEALTELLRLILGVQDMASGLLSEARKGAIHGLVAGFMHLVATLTAIPALCAHIELVTKAREDKAFFMLPECNQKLDRRGSRGSQTSVQSGHKSAEEVAEELLFNKATIAEALRSSGHDTTRLLAPFLPGSVVDSSMTRSVSDLNAITVDVDSVTSSPGMPRKHPDEDLTFESLRKILKEPLSVEQEAREERRQQVVERYKTAPFPDLVAKSERKTTDLQHRLSEIFSKLPILTAPPPVVTVVRGVSMEGEEEKGVKKVQSPVSNPFTGLCNYSYNARGPPLFAVQFPDLFVY
jgi:hypothetical protein